MGKVTSQTPKRGEVSRAAAGGGQPRLLDALSRGWALCGFTVLIVALAAANALAVQSAPTSGSAPPGADLALTGVVGGAFKVAIIESGGVTHIVRVGERVGAASVVGIASDRVVLKQGRSVFTIGLARVSRVNSLATDVGTGAGPSAPGSAGAGAAQPPSTAQPVSAPAAPILPAPVDAATGTPGPAQGAPAYQIPSQAQPVLLVVPPNTLPAGQPMLLVIPPNGLPPAQPVVLVLPSNTPQPPIAPYLYVVPSNTPQPPIPPVMPFGSRVYTP